MLMFMAIIGMHVLVGYGPVDVDVGVGVLLAEQQ